MVDILNKHYKSAKFESVDIDGKFAFVKVLRYPVCKLANVAKFIFKKRPEVKFVDFGGFVVTPETLKWMK